MDLHWFCDRDALRHQLILFLLVVLVLSISLVWGFTNLGTPDPYDYAQLARNLAKGSGFTTQVISPISWSKIPALSPHPDLWRAPLYPLFVSLGFLLFGPSEFVLPLVSGLAFIGVVLVTYGITKQLFDRSSAFLAGLFVLTAPGLLRTGVTGYTESLYMLLVLLGVQIVLADDRQPYLLGIVSAFAYLTRYNHWFLLIGILYVALDRIKRDRFGYGLRFAGAFLLVLSPWLLRNAYWTGNPFYHHHAYLLASHNPINRGFTVFFQFDPPDLLTFVLNHPVLMIKKSLGNLLKLYRWIPRFFMETWPLVLIAIPCLVSSETRANSDRRRVLVIFGIGFILQGLALSFVHIKARHFVPFTLVVFIFAAGSFSQWMATYGSSLRYSLGFMLVAVNLFFAFTMGPAAQSVTAADYRNLNQHVPPGEPILTNVPELTSWYADRPSLWMVSYEKSMRRYPDFDYIYITPEIRRDYPQQLDIRHDYLRNDLFQNRFELAEEFPESEARLYRKKSEFR